MEAKGSYTAGFRGIAEGTSRVGGLHSDPPIWAAQISGVVHFGGRHSGGLQSRAKDFLDLATHLDCENPKVLINPFNQIVN